MNSMVSEESYDPYAFLYDPNFRDEDSSDDGTDEGEEGSISKDSGVREGTTSDAHPNPYSPSGSNRFDPDRDRRLAAFLNSTSTAHAHGAMPDPNDPYPNPYDCAQSESSYADDEEMETKSGRSETGRSSPGARSVRSLTDSLRESATVPFQNRKMSASGIYKFLVDGEEHVRMGE